VAIVLDREATNPLLAHIPISEPLQKRVHQRRVPDDLSL
jgi:hypothetical protein